MSKESDKKRMKAEKARIDKSKAKRMADLENEEKIRVKFQNLESPGFPVDFNFQGLKYYKLQHDGVYDLPISVVDHLNGLAVPIYRMYDPDVDGYAGLTGEPGKVEDRIVGTRNRFSVVPIDIRGLTKSKKAESKAA